MGPEQATTSTTEGSTTEGALGAEAPPPAPSDEAKPPEPQLPHVSDPAVAPGVPRLGTPFGAGRAIPGVDGSGPPSYVFLAVVSIVSLVADVATKLWAEHTLDGYPGIIHVWENHVAFILAKNPGGAWGLLHSTSETVRRPFFLLVSAAAIAFIVTLYRKLQPRQRALKWGLPLVLGGALGNVYDRIRYGHVIDFIDVHLMYKGQDRHWPTFNVADIAICVGVALMAIDMFTARRPRRTKVEPIYILPPPPPAPEVPAPDVTTATTETAATETATETAPTAAAPAVGTEADKPAS